MNYASRQRGMSFLALVSILVVLGFVFFIGLKLFPVYMESFKIDATLQNLIEDPGIKDQSVREIGKSIVRRFNIDSVERIQERNLKDYVTITKKKDKVAIDINYQAEAPLFHNLTLVAKFNKHVEN